MQQNLIFKDKYLQFANQKTALPTFVEGQQVYLTKPTPPGVNRKLYPKYEGPFIIIKKLSDITFELRISPTRSIIVHASRLKHHVSPSIGRNLDSKNILNPENTKEADKSQSNFPAPSNHQTSPDSKQTTSAKDRPTTSHEEQNPPIRRSQRIAARQMASTTDKGEQRIFSVTVKVQESDEKQIIKIPRSNQPLAPRNSVRVDKESVEDQIARLQ